MHRLMFETPFHKTMSKSIYVVVGSRVKKVNPAMPRSEQVKASWTLSVSCEVSCDSKNTAICGNIARANIVEDGSEKIKLGEVGVVRKQL